MPLQPETKYEAKVLDAFMTETKTKGTDALYFKLETEAGKVGHFAYVTPKTIERLKETLLECFGVTSKELEDPSFLEKIGDRIRGEMVSITTDEGDEQYGVKVKWMNPIGFTPQKSEPAKLKRVAAMFAGGPVSSPAYKAGGPPPLAWGNQSVTDDDVPF